MPVRSKYSPSQLLLLPSVRYLVAWARYQWFVRIRRRLTTFDGVTGDIAKNTIMHNLRGVRRDLAVNRSLKLVRPLTSIDEVSLDARVLCIGPRTEGELLALRGHGFTNVRGLDLISYSPLIDVGDMHEMPYEDSSFDLVILGWVLAYSENRRKAASEVVRILRDGGIVALGVNYLPKTPEEIKAELGYHPAAENRIRSLREALELFGGHVHTQYFSHDIAPSRMDQPGSIIGIFSVAK